MNVSVTVYHTLGGRSWKPGQKLPSENELAAQFGVSRVTVRNALQRLSGLGLLETRFGEGSFIRGPGSGAALNQLVPMLYLTIKIAGAAYLLYLAWRALRPGGESAFAPRQLPNDRPRRLFVMGAVTNLLNPKIAVLYMSLLPQFVDPHRGHIAEQTLILGLVQITVALTVNCMIVLSAAKVARFLGNRPAWLRAQRYLMGTVLAGLAVRIATDPR